MSAFGFSTTGKEVVEKFSSSVNGKTILITGPSANSIGAEAAISLCHASPSLILLAGRTESKITPVIEQMSKINASVTVKFVQVDLASQASIRSAAKSISSFVDKIDILINSAGVMALEEFQTTKEGVEIQFGTNHLGHFLLTNLIMSKILAAGKGARIVNLSSTGFELAGVRFDDYNFKDGKAYDPWKAYAQSKTANVLFAAALADRLKSKGVQAYALQPGLVGSNLANHVTPESWANALKQAAESSGGKVTELEPMKTLQQGCSTVLVAALDPSIAGSSGGFLQNCILRFVEQDYAKGKVNVDKLWGLSEKLVGEKFEL